MPNKRPYRFRFFRSKDGVRFRLVAGNGEIVAASEAYTNEAKARGTAGKIVEQIGGGNIVVEDGLCDPKGK